MGTGLAVEPEWGGAVDGVVVRGWCGGTNGVLTIFEGYCYYCCVMGLWILYARARVYTTGKRIARVSESRLSDGVSTALATFRQAVRITLGVGCGL